MGTLVSIVMPSFQSARFLRAAIDSVLEQDHEPLELLVLDGGSTDGSVAILEECARRAGPRLWWRSARDGGQCAAINQGFARARGEVVAWLNSDDVYYPGAVRRAVAALAEHPECALVYGDGDLIDEHGGVLGRFPETVDFDLWRLANVADYILQPTAFFRRSALFAHGCARTGEVLDTGLHWALDWDLWLRLGARVPFARIDGVLAASRLHAGTKTATGGWPRLREILAVLRRHGVRRSAPAGVAHAATTLARRWRPGDAPVGAEPLCATLPRGLRGMARPLLRSAEYRLRRWLQNAQGWWPDRYLASFGRLWLPHDGAPARVVLRGANLDLADQSIGVRVLPHGPRARADRLAPLQPFVLELDVPAGCSPLRLRVAGARTRRGGVLDPPLGPRRAGARLEPPQLVRA
jgi:hypothetical protein